MSEQMDIFDATASEAAKVAGEMRALDHLVDWRTQKTERERYANVTRNEQRTNRPTNQPKTRGRGTKVPVPPAPVDNYCPKDGATIQPDGHCPVCEYVKGEG